MPALPQDNKVLSSTATGLEWVEIAQPDLTQYYNKTEIDHKILGGVADDDFSSKNISGIVKHKYNDGDNYIWVSQNLYPSEINGLQEFMNNAITIQSVENQFPVLQTFTADSFLELATDQKVLYITLTQYSPLKIEYQYGTGSVITHTYTTFNELGYPHWLNINISQYDYIAFRITAPFEFRLRLEKYYLDPDYISASTQSTSYTSPQQISQDNGSLYLHHDNGDGTGGYHRIINFILDPPRYQNKFKSAVIPADTTKIDYMDFRNISGTHYLRIGRNDVYSDINLDVNLGWLAGANHNHDTVYAHINHNHDGVYLKTVDDVFAFMDRSKFEINADDNRINLKGNLSYFTESSSTDSIGTATTTLDYNGNIDITGNLDCVNVNATRITFGDSTYIDSATGLGGGGGGGVVNYTDIQVPTITETVPGNLNTYNVTPTVAPDHYYIDQASPATEYTVLQTDATNLRIHYKFDNSASLFENSAPSSANPVSLTFTAMSSSSDNGIFSTNDKKINNGSLFKSSENQNLGFTITPFNWLYQFFNTNKQATFAFWVKNTEESTPFQTIFRQDSSFVIRQYGNNIQVWVGPNEYRSHDVFTTDQVAFDYNVWTHISVLIDLSTGTSDDDVVKIFKNGVEIPTTPYAYGDDPMYSTDIVGVGFYNDTDPFEFLEHSGGHGFKGYLDDFRIYDTVLTADEISLLYNQKVLVNIEPQDIPTTTDYKTLTFTSKPDLVYDFTPYNDLASWNAYASSIGAEVYNNSFGQGGIYHHPGNGFIELVLPNGYDYISVFFGNPHSGGTTYLYIDGIQKSTCGTGITKTYSQSYTPGQTLKILESAGIIHPDLKITLSQTQTPYTLTFDNPTECDILIVAGGGAGGYDRAGGGGAGGLVFQQNVSLTGQVNIKVGKGGVINSDDTISGGNGNDSSVNNIIALGGGGGGGERVPASTGGSGGGSSYSHSSSHYGDGLQPTQTPSIGYGNRGGDARNLSSTTSNRGGGGGGGAGGVGLEATSQSVGGAGGVGLSGIGSIDFKEHFGLPTSGIGEYIPAENKIYFAGGGGAGECIDTTSGATNYGLGGKGGGSDGKETDNTIEGAMPNSGGGGGGGGNVYLASRGHGSNGGSGIVIIRYKTTYTTGSAPVITQITPRGVLKYNTNDEWSLSTISQTDIADLEQNSIIKFLLRQSLELQKRVYELETSTPVLWDTIGIYEYKYEYGNDWAIIKDNNETFTISNRRVTNNLFIRLVNYYPKIDNNYLLKSGSPHLIDDTTLPLQIYNFKYGDSLPANPTIRINSSETYQLTLNEPSYVTAIRIQISYTDYDNTFAYANLPASITVPINDVIIIKILDIDTYIPGEREYYYRTTVSNTGSSFPIVQHAGFVSENIFPEVIALSATSTIYRLGLDVYTGGVQLETATENIAMSIDINVV